MDYLGTIPDIIENRRGAYEGDLRPYYRAVFFNAQNLRNPYHNLRHMMHVFWLCYDAVLYYGGLPKRGVRDLLIAALFHDFGHSGRRGNDDLNITLAIRGLKDHIQAEDIDRLPTICNLIKTTQFPHTTPSSQLDLYGSILRDADMAQVFSPAWIQQVIFGLATEWGQSPLEVLKMQTSFLRNLPALTDWARAAFPQAMIDAKIAEVAAHLAILEP
jgi:hypothetical protein